MYPQQPIPARARRRGLKTILAVAIPAALVLTVKGIEVPSLEEMVQRAG